MSPYLLTPQAEEDLFDIWSYIARDSLDAANRVETEIYGACAFLASTPQAGHVRHDLTNLSVRFWTLPHFSHYVVVYDPALPPAADHSHSSWGKGYSPSSANFQIMQRRPTMCQPGHGVGGN
jgi:plasmid stabilization system protein ParE